MPKRGQQVRSRQRAHCPRSADHLSLACESGHWIETVEGDGKIIKLEDGSLWEVDDIDTVTTSIWLPVSNVIVCTGKMINVDDSESAAVTPVMPSRGGRGTLLPGTSGTHSIEAAANDETFIINGEIFKAKTYCFGFERGDQVRFSPAQHSAHVRRPRY